MVDNVIDMRPSTFLREISEGTGILEAGKKAGIEHDELVKMLEDDPKFAHTIREIVLDRAEGIMRDSIEELILDIHKTAEECVTLLRHQTEEAVAAIHEFSSKDNE